MANIAKYKVIPIFILFLSGCIAKEFTTIPTIIEVTKQQVEKSKIITQEITRIIYVYPTQTSTNTRTPSCYDDARTQRELNQCAGKLTEEARIQLEKLVTAVTNKIFTDQESRDKFLQLQTYWLINAKEECRLWYGQIIWDPETGTGYYKNGSMAPMLVASCLREKYKIRIVELTNLLN